MDEILLRQREDGVFEEYKPYCLLDIETEEEMDTLRRAVDLYQRVLTNEVFVGEWKPVSEPPEKEGWYHVAILDTETGKYKVKNGLYVVEAERMQGNEPGFCKVRGWPEGDRITHWMKYPEPPDVPKEARADGN